MIFGGPPVRVFIVEDEELMLLLPTGKAVLWCQGSWYPRAGSRRLAREVLEEGNWVEIIGCAETILEQIGVTVPSPANSEPRSVAINRLVLWLKKTAGGRRLVHKLSVQCGIPGSEMARLSISNAEFPQLQFGSGIRSSS
jgi:hypothetical protein